MNLITILLISNRNIGPNNFSNLLIPLTNVKGILNTIAIPTISETDLLAAIKVLKILALDTLKFQFIL